jgi:hypothetical protein
MDDLGCGIVGVDGAFDLATCSTTDADADADADAATDVSCSSSEVGKWTEDGAARVINLSF